MPCEGFSFSGFFLSSLRSFWSVGCFMEDWMVDDFLVSPLTGLILMFRANREIGCFAARRPASRNFLSF
jgi:hypothetical protein